MFVLHSANYESVSLWILCEQSNSVRVNQSYTDGLHLNRKLSCLLGVNTQYFSSVTQSCPTLHDPMDCSMPGFLVHHQLPELAQTHVHRVSDAIQPSHPLLSPSLPKEKIVSFNLSQHRGLFQRVSSLHQVAKVLEFQLQHQSFQWIFRTDFL